MSYTSVSRRVCTLFLFSFSSLNDGLHGLKQKESDKDRSPLNPLNTESEVSKEPNVTFVSLLFFQQRKQV